MRTPFILLAGLALQVSSWPSLAQNPALAGPQTTAATHLTESVTLYESGEFEGSLFSAREALKLLNQTSAIAYNNICAAHLRLEQYELAIRACLNSLELAPGFKRARNNLAWIYEVQAGKHPSVEAYLNLGEVRYRQGAFEESKAASVRALEIDPGSAVAYNNLCAAYAANGQWSQAIVECEMSLAIDPGYELARSNLVWALSGQTKDQ